MTVEERLAELERRVQELEALVRPPVDPVEAAVQGIKGRRAQRARETNP